jgi:hypothetical protein
MNATVNTTDFTISIDGNVVYTAPTDWEPIGQLMGELDEMEDAGSIDRATRKRLQTEVMASPAGVAQQRTKAWQRAGVR